MAAHTFTAEEIRELWTGLTDCIRADGAVVLIPQALADAVTADLLDGDGEPLPDTFQALADRLNARRSDRQDKAMQHLRETRQRALEASAAAAEANRDFADAVRGCIGVKVPVVTIAAELGISRVRVYQISNNPH